MAASQLLREENPHETRRLQGEIRTYDKLLELHEILLRRAPTVQSIQRDPSAHFTQFPRY